MLLNIVVPRDDERHCGGTVDRERGVLVWQSLHCANGTLSKS
jgi:hypothetical protein